MASYQPPTTYPPSLAVSTTETLVPDPPARAHAKHEAREDTPGCKVGDVCCALVIVIVLGCFVAFLVLDHKSSTKEEQVRREKELAEEAARAAQYLKPVLDKLLKLESDIAQLRAARTGSRRGM
jgi:uncharacterized protein HemX